jgi:hypothetical protein
VAVFVAVAAATFMASAPLANWVKSRSELFGSLPVQAVLALPFFLLISMLEERLIWKLLRQDAFSTIHPVSLGAYIGYVIHFALR